MASIWNAIAGSIPGALVGRTAGVVGENLRDERLAKRKYNEQLGLERYNSRQRLGEMTLKQMLEEGSTEGIAKAGESVARRRKAEAEAETYEGLTPEERKRLVMAPAERVGYYGQSVGYQGEKIPIAKQHADAATTRAETGVAKQELLASKSEKPEGFHEREAQWISQARPLSMDGKVDDAYWTGMDLGLVDDPKSPWYSAPFKNWINTVYKPYVQAKNRAEKKTGGAPAPVPEVGGSPGLGAPRPRAPALSVPAEVPQFAPSSMPALGAPAEPAAAPVPTAALPGGPAPVPADTTGLDPDDIAAIQRYAAQNGLSFEEARAQLEEEMARRQPGMALGR